MTKRKLQTGRVFYVPKHVAKHRAWYTVALSLVLLVGAASIIYAFWPQEQKLSTNPAVAEYQRQLPDLQKAAAAAPEDASAQQNLAIALYASGDAAAAKGQYEKLAKLSPNDPTVFNNLANTQRDLGDTSAAITSYKKSLQLNPKQANVYSNLANVQLYTLSDTNAAIKTYEEGLVHLPNNSDLEYLLGAAYERTGHKTDALATYEHIITYEPSHRPTLAAIERLK